MPINLTQALIEEKNKVENSGAWVVLLRLTSPDLTTDMFLCRNNEDLTVNGQLYQAFPFDLDEVIETNNGALPSFNLKVSNIDRVVQSYIEQDVTFGSGWDVLVSVVHSDNLAGSPEIEIPAVSLEVSCDKNFATFSCGIANPMMQQFPRQKYSGGFCQRVFKDGEGCTYAGVDTECLKTLDDCKTKFPLDANGYHRVNSLDQNIGLPYLAFAGIPSRAIYR